MDSSDLFLMLAGVLLVGSLVFLNIQKISDEINQENKKEANNSYIKFCDFITLELAKIKCDDESFDEKIDDFIREIKHIKSMNVNSQKGIFSQKIAAVMLRVDEYLKEQNKELLAQSLKNKLKDEFYKL